MDTTSYTAMQRRAANQVWSAAGAYDFEPLFLAQHADHSPDLYMNGIVGLVHKYYGENIIRSLFACWAGDVHQTMLDELTWLYLEHVAYTKELPQRPILADLRRIYAEAFFGQEYKLSRQEWMAKNQLVYTLQASRWCTVLERKQPVLTPREKSLASALSPKQLPEPEQIQEEILAIYKRFLLFDGKIHQKRALHVHVTGKLAEWLTKTMPTQLVKTDRVTVTRSAQADPLQGDGFLQKKNRAQVTLKQNASQDHAYIESCFGRSLYTPEQLRRAEQELCTGNHLGCHLWFTDGAPSQNIASTAEAKHLMEQAELQAVRNRAYYSENIDLHRSAILRLTEQIRNCMLVHQQPRACLARCGKLDTAHVWRAPVLQDNRVFLHAEEENQPLFTVDLLLDASASRLHCQEMLAAQGVILAQSLLACRIPVRVSSFCSLRGYTVLRLLKNFEEKDSQSLFRYFSSGWNRDGLVIRAVGDLLTSMPCPAQRHLCIILTDASPNDSFRVLVSPEHPFGHDYGDAFGVQDTAAEVRALRKKGIRIAAVFMGESSSVSNAAAIYGKEFARIKGIDQLAKAAGLLIQNEIRALDNE